MIPRFALAVLSGLLLFLSFPKFGYAPVAWLALAPLLVALSGTRGWRAAQLGYVAGVTSAIGLLYWTALVVVQFGGLALPVGIAVMLLLALAFSLFTALFAWATAEAMNAFGPAGIAVAPFAWVGTEALRAYTFFRFPWCLLGYSQYTQLPVIQIADITGVYGVSFLVLATSTAAAFLWLERRTRPRAIAAAGVVVLLAASLAYGYRRLAHPAFAETGRIRAGLVQASILQDEKWDPAKEAENLGRHVALSHEAAQQGARLIVWPESAVPFFFDEDEATARQIRELAAATNAAVLFGNDDVMRRGSERPRAWVGAKMVRPDGTLAYRYHKNRLVPFGEYVPLKPLFTLGGTIAARLVRQVADFEPGTEATVGALDGHTLGASICYEAIFPDFVRLFSKNGAELLVNVTNDAWYGTTSAPFQHFSMAVFRAVESRKWLLRAANTGITAFVDPQGRIVARTQLFERRTLVGEAAFVPGVTTYARVGDVFAWGCFAVAASALALGRGRRPR